MFTLSATSTVSYSINSTPEAQSDLHCIIYKRTMFSTFFFLLACGVCMCIMYVDACICMYTWICVEVRSWHQVFSLIALHLTYFQGSNDDSSKSYIYLIAEFFFQGCPKSWLFYGQIWAIFNAGNQEGGLVVISLLIWKAEQRWIISANPFGQKKQRIYTFSLMIFMLEDRSSM